MWCIVSVCVCASETEFLLKISISNRFHSMPHCHITIVPRACAHRHHHRQAIQLQTMRVCNQTTIDNDMCLCAVRSTWKTTTTTTAATAAAASKNQSLNKYQLKCIVLQIYMHEIHAITLINNNSSHTYTTINQTQNFYCGKISIFHQYLPNNFSIMFDFFLSFLVFKQIKFYLHSI